MHHISLRHGFNAFSARRRRTVSRDSSVCPVSLTISPASSSSVQRARPSGGPEQAVAISSASSLPDSLRAAPGRGPSFNPASRLPSTKRRLVRCTVESLTATQAAIVSSLLPASAANKICARFSLRAACLPPFSIELSSAPAILIGRIAAQTSSCELSLDMGRRFCVDQGLHERRPVGKDEIGRDGSDVLEEAGARAFGGSGLGPELFEAVADRMECEGEQVHGGEHHGEVLLTVAEVVLEVVAVALEDVEAFVLDLPSGPGAGHD